MKKPNKALKEAAKTYEEIKNEMFGERTTVTTQFMLLNEDDEHEYDVIIETTGDTEEVFILAANNDSWREPFRGQPIMSMIDDGNAITFSKEFKGPIEYDDAFCIRTLFKIRESRKDQLASPYKMIEKKAVAII